MFFQREGIVGVFTSVEHGPKYPPLSSSIRHWKATIECDRRNIAVDDSSPHLRAREELQLVRSWNRLRHCRRRRLHRYTGLELERERHEKRAARAYIERMREDIAASARNVENAVAFYRAVQSHALAALEEFEKPQDELGEQFLIDAYQANQGFYRPVERSTYDEILSAGAMNSIRNLEVRRRIVIHYKTVEATEGSLRLRTPYSDNLRRYMPYAVQATAFERCRPDTAVDARGFATVTMRENCDLGLQSETVVTGITAIRIPEIKLDLVRRWRNSTRTSCSINASLIEVGSSISFLRKWRCDFEYSVRLRTTDRT